MQNALRDSKGRLRVTRRHWLLELLEAHLPAEDIVMANPFKTCIIAEAQVSPAPFALFVHHIDHFAQARKVPLLRGEDEAGEVRDFWLAAFFGEGGGVFKTAD